jgi:hypothetical protein
MSAQLDRSQGFTFVYSNIHKLYSKAKASQAALAVKSDRVLKNNDADVREFKPRTLQGERTFPLPMGVREAEEKALQAKMKSAQNLKKNIEGLSEAHEKLRFLLDELDTLTKKKN